MKEKRFYIDAVQDLMGVLYFIFMAMNQIPYSIIVELFPWSFNKKDALCRSIKKDGSIKKMFLLRCTFIRSRDLYGIQQRYSNAMHLMLSHHNAISGPKGCTHGQTKKLPYREEETEAKMRSRKYDV